jgi:hypothetical protein
MRVSTILAVVLSLVSSGSAVAEKKVKPSQVSRQRLIGELKKAAAGDSSVVSARELAERVNLAPGRVAKMLRTLAHRGFVTWVKDGPDVTPLKDTPVDELHKVFEKAARERSITPERSRVRQKQPALEARAYVLRYGPNQVSRPLADVLVKDVIPGSKVTVERELAAEAIEDPRLIPELKGTSRKKAMQTVVAKALRHEEITTLESGSWKEWQTEVSRSVDRLLPIGARLIARVRDPFGRTRSVRAGVRNEPEGEARNVVSTELKLQGPAIPIAEREQPSFQDQNVFATRAFLATVDGRESSYIKVRGIAAAKGDAQVRFVNLRTGEVVETPASRTGAFLVTAEAEQNDRIVGYTRLGRGEPWVEVVRYVVPVTRKLATGSRLRYEPVVARDGAPRLETRATVNRRNQRILKARPLLVEGDGARRGPIGAAYGKWEQAPLETVQVEARLAEVFEAFDPGAVEELQLVFKPGLMPDRVTPALALEASGLTAEMDQAILDKIIAIPGLPNFLTSAQFTTVKVALDAGDGGAAKVTVGQGR